MPKKFLTLMGIATVILAASNVFLYSEFQSLAASIDQSKPLSETDIVSVIDQRLDVISQRKTHEQFAQLKAQYQLAQPMASNDRFIYGNQDARITIQEFGDIECPYCQRMHGELKTVIDQSEGVLNWEFKHFPLNRHNPMAALQAKAVECVRDSYGNQTAWAALDQFMARTEGGGEGVGDITKFTQSLGLSGSLIDMCMASTAHESRITQDFQQGQSMGITGTPALRIQDHKTGQDILIRGYKTPEQILQAIQHILKS
jgi:protein-disulfide isomerase